MNFPIIASKSKDMKIIAGLAFFLSMSSISFGQLDYAKILGDTASKPNDKKFNIALQVGAGTRTGVFLERERENNRDFNRRLNYGFHLEFQPTYFIKSNWGVGLVANMYCAQSTGNYEMTNDQNPDIVIRKSTQTDAILFVGPALVGRYEYEKFRLQYSVAGGVQAYGSEMKWDEPSAGKSYKTQVMAATWSVGANLHIGYQVMEGLHVFLSPAYYFGLVNRAEFKAVNDEKMTRNLKGEDRIDLSRFSLGLGASYSF